MFLVLCDWSLKTVNYDFPRAKVEAHFLKTLAFVTKKCLAQGAFRKCPGATENLSKYTAVRE